MVLLRGGFVFSAPGYHAIRRPAKNEKARFAEGDVLVLFGELFNRGYANGLVEEAERRGMKIIRATVGRRDKDGSLRALTAEEMAAQPAPLINIPLEAGFDMEPASDGLTPADRLKDIKLSDWESARLDMDKIRESREKGRARFARSVRQFLKELEPHLPAGKNILFAHLMAGGVPRAKIIMPLMNRSVKGTGERFLESERFWKTDLGQLCEMNFQEVTARTFDVLLEETAALRKSREERGNFVAYTAYGYHGTEVLIDGAYDWQTYTPYLQGWAKKSLEEFSRKWSAQGARSCVYNCPEILTNSSSIFQGVEIPLYPLLLALKKENPSSPKTKKIWDECAALIKPEASLESMLTLCNETMKKPAVRAHCVFEKWPQHNAADQLEIILDASGELTDSHKDTKSLMTTVLSEIVFSSCGKVMLEDSAFPQNPVTWLNHDVVARTYFET
jgi:hypothetical protein